MEVKYEGETQFKKKEGRLDENCLASQQRVVQLKREKGRQTTRCSTFLTSQTKESHTTRCSAFLTGQKKEDKRRGV